MTRASASALLFATLAAAPASATAQIAPALPSPLTLADAMRIAGERRDEVAAARARVRAGEARPAIVSALADPMISSSLDHLPFMLNGADVSVAIEQQIPLSGIRDHRRAAALADASRLRAIADRTVLDVKLQAAGAYLMLQERRRTADLLSEQVASARDMAAAASARYASGTAPQSEVLRAELEVARLEAERRGLLPAVRAAEAMLNAALGQDTSLAVPPLVPIALRRGPPSWAAVASALAARPEFEAGRADITRAEAEIAVMRDMSRPMATIRTGPSYTMTDGPGWMAMVGVSLPIWSRKLRAGVAEAEAMRAMAEADLRAMTRMIEGEAAAALAELQSAHERQSALANDVLPRARMAIDAAVANYAAGRLPLVSVIDSIQTSWSVQSSLIAAESQLALAWIRLGRAVGSYEVIGQ